MPPPCLLWPQAGTILVGNDDLGSAASAIVAVVTVPIDVYPPRIILNVRTWPGQACALAACAGAVAPQPLPASCKLLLRDLLRGVLVPPAAPAAGHGRLWLPDHGRDHHG